MTYLLRRRSKTIRGPTSRPVMSASAGWEAVHPTATFRENRISLPFTLLSPHFPPIPPTICVSKWMSLNILSRVGVRAWLIRWGFGLDDWIYWHLIHTTRDYRQYSAIVDLHALKFIVIHALRFSVCTSRIPATDISQSHCNLKSHKKSSRHSLIPFLPFLLNQFRLLFPELDPFLDN
jgi:hypothetical protein